MSRETTERIKCDSCKQYIKGNKEHMSSVLLTTPNRPEFVIVIKGHGTFDFDLCFDCLKKIIMKVKV